MKSDSGKWKKGSWSLNRKWKNRKKRVRDFEKRELKEEDDTVEKRNAEP